MAYIRKTIDIEQVKRQEEICARISARLDETAPTRLALVDTYGCQQNEADSEKIRGYLALMGYGFTKNEFEADIIVVNTCAVREHAEMRVLGNVGALNHSKKVRPGQIIAVCGCMVQQEHMANKIKMSYPVVDLVFGPHELWRFPELLEQVMEKHRRVFATEKSDGAVVEGIPLRRDGKYKAWLSIMYGCNNFCTYCIVPYTRGREISRAPEDILREIKDLAADGVKEVTLLGQNVNSYGRGGSFDCDFADLVYMINDVEGIERIRFMTSHPKDLSDKLIQAFKDCPKLCRHIHLPVQAGSSRTLKRMNRYYDKDQYLDLVDRIKAAVPDIAITTDIIVGFPGETEEDFEETIDLVKKVRYDSAFTFLYSIRTGTPAATYEDQIPEEVKHARFERLVDTLNGITAEKNALYQDRIVEVLVDGPSERGGQGTYAGRTDTFKLINFKAGRDLTGEIVKLRVSEAKTFSLEGELI